MAESKACSVVSPWHDGCECPPLASSEVTHGCGVGWFSVGFPFARGELGDARAWQ